MMYNVGDKVMVFWDGELYYEEVEITWVSDDEEVFELVGKNYNEFKGVYRKNIFYDYEVDKLALCMTEGKEEVIEKVSDNEYLEKYKNGEYNDWITIISDVNLEPLTGAVASALGEMNSVVRWFNELFSHYSENALLYCKEDEMYYMILVG